MHGTRLAAENTIRTATLNAALSRAPLPRPERHLSGLTTAHAVWLLAELQDGRVTGEKSHRWLGWAQAILAVNGLLSLEEAKKANQEASDREKSHD